MSVETGETLRVLIAGQDAVVAKALRDALATWTSTPHVTEIASSLQTALQMFTAATPDVVLLICGTPEKSGLALLSRLRLARPDVPVIMVSRRGNPQRAVHAVQAGAADYLPIAGLPRLLGKAVQLAIEKIRTARELDRLNSDLVGIVSHDLRAPTSNILSYVELALEPNASGPLDERRHAMLIRIRENGMHILSLIHDLLETVRIDSGKLQLVLGRHDIASLIRESMDRCSFLAGGKEIVLRADCPSAPTEAIIDRAKMLQVLNNLVSNAIKFSRPGSSVTVGARSVGHFVEIRVADDGLGIPADEVHKLFQKFSSTTTRPTRGERGTGLGLYIVSEFVKLHGGVVWAASVPGKGTTVTMRIPKDGMLTPAADRSLPRTGSAA